MSDLDRVIRIVAPAVGCRPDELTIESGLNRHPGWDSLAHIEVIAELENAFGIVIDESVIDQTMTIGGIVDLLNSGRAEGVSMEDEVSFTSFDGLELSGTLRKAEGDQPLGYALLVHGITATREEWGFFTQLAERLAGWSITSLRFDYRCHGSASRLPMTDLSLSGISNDVDAAAAFLREQSSPASFGLLVAGVSFGGGVVAEWAGRHSDDVRLLVLCSPVLDYEADLMSSAPGWRVELGSEDRIHYSEVILSRALASELPTWGRLLEAPWPNAVIFHGDADQDVPIDRSRTVAKRKAVALVEVPGADHGFVEPGDFDAESERTLENYEFVFADLKRRVAEVFETP